MELKNILLSILAICVVTIVPHLGLIPLPFGYCIPMLLVVWLHLKYNKENFSTIGFSIKAFHIKSFVIGAIAAILIFSFLYFVFFPLLEIFIKLEDVDVDLYKQIRGNKGFYIFILIMGWLVGGLYEEIIFHGFIFTRIEKMLTAKDATIISFIFTGILFGLYHLQLGTGGVINAFLAGVGYHALTLFYKRNLWYGIFCHAVFDTIAITLIYLGSL